MHTRLIPLDGGPAVDLVKEMTLIGRNEDADFQINHKSVSKLHCILVKADGLVLVRDLGSTNGTRVNGQRVRRAALLPNDHIAFANFRYRLKLGDDPDDPASELLPVPAASEAIDDPHDTPPPEPSPVQPSAQPPLRRNTLPDVYPENSEKS